MGQGLGLGGRPILAVPNHRFFASASAAFAAFLASAATFFASAAFWFAAALAAAAVVAEALAPRERFPAVLEVWRRGPTVIVCLGPREKGRRVPRQIAARLSLTPRIGPGPRGGRGEFPLGLGVSMAASGGVTSGTLASPSPQPWEVDDHVALEGPAIHAYVFSGPPPDRAVAQLGTFSSEGRATAEGVLRGATRTTRRRTRRGVGRPFAVSA